MKLHINCDLGEGINDDAKIMTHINACNIACGGHFGNEKTINTAIKLAKNNTLLIGAHPSYPDKENFGRKKLTISNQDLQTSLFNQIQKFLDLCHSNNVRMNHIKLHGALYNESCVNKDIALLVLDVYSKFENNFSLFVPDGSIIAKLAKNKYLLCYEAFIDRRYNKDLSLVNRQQKNAHITDNHLALNQVISILKHGKVKCIDETFINLKADTFCLHSDSPNALNLVKFLRKKCQ